MSLLSFENVSKSLADGARTVPVLAGVSFDIDPGDYVGLWGGRRSGKSMVLRLAAGVERPDGGEIVFDGKNIAAMSMDKRAHLRQRGGIALALAEWSPTARRPVVEHVAFPLVGCGLSFHDAEAAARRALRRVGAEEVQDWMTDRLNLAERIRVELARALVREPRLLLVDEPTLLASPSEAHELYELLRSLGRDRERAMVIASEQSAAIEGAPRILRISNGRVRSSDGRRKVLAFPRASAAPPGS
jgi:predicted ABC-type transport system involved in lysophospholipase L1 biosynthesis ATPase subunit